MADQVSITAIVEGLTKTAALPLSPAETVILKESVAPAAADVEIALGGLTNPKMLVVLAGPGVSIRKVASTGSVLNANPFYAECCEPGMALTSIFVSNAGSQPVQVTILAAE